MKSSTYTLTVSSYNPQPSGPSTSDQPPQQLVSGEVAADGAVQMELESEDQEAEEKEDHRAKEKQFLSGESFHVTGKMLFLQQKELVIVC